MSNAWGRPGQLRGLPGCQVGMSKLGEIAVKHLNSRSQDKADSPLLTQLLEIVSSGRSGVGDRGSHTSTPDQVLKWNQELWSPTLILPGSRIGDSQPVSAQALG